MGTLQVASGGSTSLQFPTQEKNLRSSWLVGHELPLILVLEEEQGVLHLAVLRQVLPPHHRNSGLARSSTR